ncbi:MAG: ImmA/IrrE family metallo-endopeptidase [Chloroflexi bacterium]|nr:ImmA/IrrE family metallo-endopeptidase [Chloroflexota bacterium]
MKKNKFRYGFKKECEDYAGEFREELHLAPHDPLCPRKLAHHLGIPVFGIKDSQVIDPEVIQHWQQCAGGGFSGLIIQDGTRKEVHHNDFHHPRRQNSNISHELAHIILGHDLDVPIKENGERAYDRLIEEEAKWLGATLLLPKSATVHIVKNGLLKEEIEEVYGVSYSLYQFRLQVTDTMGLIRNSRRKYSQTAPS